MSFGKMRGGKARRGTSPTLSERHARGYFIQILVRVRKSPLSLFQVRSTFKISCFLVENSILM